MDQYNRFLLSVYAGAQEVPLEEFHDFALNLLNGLVPFDGAKWGSGLLDARGASFNIIHVRNDPPEALVDYNEVREQDRFGAWAFAHPGITLNSTPTDQRASVSPGILKYVRKYRHEHALITAYVNKESGQYQSLSIFGAMANHPYVEQQRLLMEAAFPHLLQALHVNQGIYLERSRPQLSCSPWYMAICDTGGLLSFYEPGFRELLQQEWPGSGPHSIPTPLQSQIFGGKKSCLRGNKIVLFAIISHDLAFIKARQRLPVDSLSTRELEIATQLACGLTHKEIARQLQIAPATVRNHIQAIHERIGIHNNPELVTQLKDAGL